jgi:acetyltransferase-like isoleucine patch superfamily enzyme
LIGSNIDILSGRHQHRSQGIPTDRAAEDGRFSQISIGTNVWIGNRSIVMAGIDDDSIVGAGSVVVRPIPRRSVAVGNPATVKRTLDQAQKPHQDRNHLSDRVSIEG